MKHKIAPYGLYGISLQKPQDSIFKVVIFTVGVLSLVAKISSSQITLGSRDFLRLGLHRMG